MNILIVDDERTALMDLYRSLAQVVPDAAITKTDDVYEAIELCRENAFDVAFLDIQMPDIDGLGLAEKIKRIRPMTNIVITTAYPEYALDAYKLYVSDYVLKPVKKEDLRNALHNLRHPVREERKGLYVQCFGDFAVFYDGEPLSFGRAKTKEFFAYLIDRKGAECTNAQIRAALWGDRISNDDRQRHYFAQITHEFRSKLNELGASDIYIQNRDSYAIVPDKIRCDYYEALESDFGQLTRFTGEYMAQYEWAMGRIGFLDKKN